MLSAAALGPSIAPSTAMKSCVLVCSVGRGNFYIFFGSIVVSAGERNEFALAEGIMIVVLGVVQLLMAFFMQKKVSRCDSWYLQYRDACLAVDLPMCMCLCVVLARSPKEQSPTSRSRRLAPLPARPGQEAWEGPPPAQTLRALPRRHRAWGRQGRARRSAPMERQ